MIYDSDNVSLDSSGKTDNRNIIIGTVVIMIVCIVVLSIIYVRHSR